jgi:hypothetical protein
MTAALLLARDPAVIDRRYRSVPKSERADPVAGIISAARGIVLFMQPSLNQMVMNLFRPVARALH